MKEDIFGTTPDKKFSYKSMSHTHILTIILGLITAAAVFDVIIHFDIFTGYIAACVADLIISGVPFLLILGVLFYLFFRAKWRMYNRFWW